MDDSNDIDEQRSMDALRNLILGKKTREIDDQIGGLEQRLNQSIAELEHRINARFDALDRFVKGEIMASQNRLNQESSELRQFSQEFREKANEVSQDLNQRTRTLSDDFRLLSDHLRSSVASEIAAIKNSAADRSELSDLLIELGMRIQPPQAGQLPEEQQPDEQLPEQSNDQWT